MNRNHRDRSKQAEVAERRQQVAAFYRDHATETEIAAMLGVSQATVSRDIQAILAEWKSHYLVDADTLVARELADLDAMERTCAVQLEATHEAIWMLRRIQVKARRAKLLGLDAPAKIDVEHYIRERALEMGLDPAEAVQEVKRSGLRLVS